MHAAGMFLRQDDGIATSLTNITYLSVLKRQIVACINLPCTSAIKLPHHKAQVRTFRTSETRAAMHDAIDQAVLVPRTECHIIDVLMNATRPIASHGYVLASSAYGIDEGAARLIKHWAAGPSAATLSVRYPNPHYLRRICSAQFAHPGILPFQTGFPYQACQ